MSRKASCSCGELQVEVNGEPKVVVACSCASCQKRTGSVFGVSAYFANDQVVAKNGEFKSFTVNVRQAPVTFPVSRSKIDSDSTQETADDIRIPSPRASRQRTVG